MSTIKSSTEHLTLNADGAGKEIKFQANGVEKASISSAGAFTSTSIDATKLSGALPAIDGSALTGVGKVLQVQHTNSQANTTTSVNINASESSWGSQISVTITPAATTSKILLDFMISGSTYSNGTHTDVKIKRIISGGATSYPANGNSGWTATSTTGNRHTANNQHEVNQLNGSWVDDTHNTTSAITYHIVLATENADTFRLNDNGSNYTAATWSASSISTIRAMEVSA